MTGGQPRAILHIVVICISCRLWLSTPPAAHVANVSSRLRGLTSTVTQTANSLSAEQTTLLFFVLASGVVFVFMLRT